MERESRVAGGRSNTDRSTASPVWRRPWAGPVAMGLVGAVLALATAAPETGGPGVTCDELYHVLVAKRLVRAARSQGWSFFAPQNIRRNFPWRADGPPFHPPLGHWVLGVTHHLMDPAPDDDRVVSITAARLAGGLVLGLTAMVAGLATWRMEGPGAGTVAAAAVILVPRMFAHARLATLDAFTALVFTAALWAVVWAERRDAKWWRLSVAGAIWGLALATRFHGLLLLPPVVAWLVWRRRWRALPALGIWALSGLVVLALSWPWLWLQPLAHLRIYLTTATARPSVAVFYAGQVWPDRQVPWHYPWVMLAVTLPLGLLLLGVAGLWAHRPWRRADAGFLLAAGTLVFVLGVFSWPGTPVYDGVRLFLMAFPLWAVAAGVGAKWAVEQHLWRSLSRARRWWILGVVLALQATGMVVYWRCPLSHYSLAVGGLAGAERLGFEVSYWGEAVDERFLAEVGHRAPGQVVVFAPNLAPFQAPGVLLGSAALAQAQVELVGWNPNVGLPPGCRFGILYHRRASLGAVPPAWLQQRAAAEHRNQGVWLARLLEIPGSLPERPPP
ncbi:MAG TPA: hypothetical protein EYP56_19155 [Planctomycetaceae bacterium]|nr:hypothetical protein [Planctomycetaceae bacterium]